MRKPIAILFLSMLAPIAHAANSVYLAPSAAGGNTGADCADAKAYTYFNSSGNWSATPTGIQIGPDTTVNLCNGTYTGTAGATLLTCQGSGSSGHPVIVLAAGSGVIITAPYWAPAITCNGESYITLDGGATHALIENSANGTSLANQSVSTGINVLSDTGVTVKNWDINPIYVYTYISPGDNSSGATGSNCIGAANGETNLVITNNLCSDATTGIVYIPQNGDSNVTVTWNTIKRSNWGFSADLASGTSNGLIFSDNDVSCVVGTTCNWFDIIGSFTYHNNCVILFPQGGSTVMNGVVLSNNYCHDFNGHSTSFFFTDPGGGATLPNELVYNNIGFTTSGQGGPADGSFGCGDGVTACLMVNNTLVNGGAIGYNAQIDPTIENNISVGMSTALNLNSGYSGVTSDYNDFYNFTTGLNAGGTNYSTLAAWVSGTGFDTHSISTNPNLTSGFALNAGSPAIGAGVNLTSLSIAGLDVGAPATFGQGGACGGGCVARSATLPWDMGAYPSGSTPPPVVPGSYIGQGTFIGKGSSIQ